MQRVFEHQEEELISVSSRVTGTGLSVLKNQTVADCVHFIGASRSTAAYPSRKETESQKYSTKKWEEKLVRLKNGGPGGYGDRKKRSLRERLLTNFPRNLDQKACIDMMLSEDGGELAQIVWRNVDKILSLSLRAGKYK